MKKNVFVFSRLAPEHLERLQCQFNVRVLEPKQGDIDAQYAAALPDTHGMIGVGRPLGARQLEQAMQLEVISSVSVGYDNYDLDYLNRRGIALTNTPDVLTETTADLGFALLISAARRVAELDAWVKAGNWKRTVDAPQFGTDVHGKKLGILGLGRIGAAIARRGRFGFGMQVLYHGNNRKPELEQELGARFLGFDELLGEADFVCVVVPLGAQTRQLIGARELGLMKPSAILVNVARGQVVDEAALVAALREKRILGAGLDVYEKEPLAESPLFALDNVVTLPHIGSATHETRRAMAERALQNFEAALRGERPLDLVNPQVWRRGWSAPPSPLGRARRPGQRRRLRLAEHQDVAEHHQDQPGQRRCGPAVALGEGRDVQRHHREQHGAVGGAIRAHAPDQGQVGGEADHRAGDRQVQQRADVARAPVEIQRHALEQAQRQEDQGAVEHAPGIAGERADAGLLLQAGKHVAGGEAQRA